MSIDFLPLTIFAVFLVHCLKAFRLFTVLFGKNISLFGHLSLYCLCVPVSILVPYKIGELFKLALYAIALRDFSCALIAILIDRFFDSLVLIIIILLNSAVFGSPLPAITILLAAILIFLSASYFVLPGTLAFWKSLFLRSSATRRHLCALRFIGGTQAAFSEIKKSLSGRASVLFVLSIFAWILEITFAVAIFAKICGKNISEEISSYLNSALFSLPTKYLSDFSKMSVAVLLTLFLILQISRAARFFVRRKNVR